MILQEIRLLDSQGKNRPNLEISCDYCKTIFYRQTRLYKAKVDGCSPKCLSLLKGSRVEASCAHCNKQVFRRKSEIEATQSGLVFCDRKCKEAAQKYNELIQPDHYGSGESNYRARAIKEYGAKCNRCDYSENIAAIVVHHIDENRQNNAIDNLEVLCANCHAIEHWGR